MHTQVHTTGSKSYAQWKIEFVSMNTIAFEFTKLEMWYCVYLWYCIKFISLWYYVAFI
jgi:hypothetical protein